MLSKVRLKEWFTTWIIHCMRILNNAPKRPLLFDQSFTLKVLGEAQQRLVACKNAKVVGRRLIAQVAERLCPDTCIKIDGDDSFLWGQVVGSWCEGSAIFAAIEFKHALSGLDALARLGSEFRESTAGPLEPAMRHCA